MTNLFRDALIRNNHNRPPVWLMRQAGRYHSHYQKLRKSHSFIDLCKVPELACETTMGPIEDFNFDAAILFSDLLFPLEMLGMGLTYDEGPKLSWHLKSKNDLSRFVLPKGNIEQAVETHLGFQANALKLIRKKLPKEKGLLGFVGGPLTLFYYAVEGSHKGDLSSARSGLDDGRLSGFCEMLLPYLVQNILIQAEAGADCIAVMDTCAGELSSNEFYHYNVPVLKKLFHQVSQMTRTPILYYSKGTTPEHLRKLQGLSISGVGIDWNVNLPQCIEEFGNQWCVQGNFDPHHMLLSKGELEPKLRTFFEAMKKISAKSCSGWICGLGHGVLPKTPEENVKLFVSLEKEYFS